MTKLQWDQVGERQYELGVDHGVLYLSDGKVVPWNGITAVEENFSAETSSPIYVDGIKMLDTESIGDFSAILKAFTYPDEFLEIEGIVEVGPGIFGDDQPAKLFNFSYRTLIADDVNGTSLGYKIHVVYNALAVQDVPDRQTQTQSSSGSEFGWNIVSIPESTPGYRPTSHVIIDSRYIAPLLLSGIEDVLYGNDTIDPYLPPLTTLVEMAENWRFITITDNGDGSWSATGPEEYVKMLDTTTFQITSSNAHYLDADTYTIASSLTP